MSNRYAFVTFIYPGIEKYFSYFIESLYKQSDTDFDLIVHNDGVEDVGKYFNSPSFPVKIVESGKKDLFGMRIWTFDYCLKNGYTHLILGDSDDYFASNRIEVNKELLIKYDIVVNDISLVNSDGVIYETRVFSRRIYHNSLISFADIADYNFIGFTNSAFSIEALKFFNACSTNSKVVDWFFFSILLLKGKSMIFTTDTVSFYRQHESNIAGLRYFNEDLDIEKQEILNNIKRVHNASIAKFKNQNIESTYDMSNIIKKIKFWWEN